MRILTKGRDLLFNPYVAWKVKEYWEKYPSWAFNDEIFEFQESYNAQIQLKD